MHTQHGWSWYVDGRTPNGTYLHATELASQSQYLLPIFTHTSGYTFATLSTRPRSQHLSLSGAGLWFGTLSAALAVPGKNGILIPNVLLNLLAALMELRPAAGAGAGELVRGRVFGIVWEVVGRVE